MRKNFTILLLMTIGFYSCGQKSTTDKVIRPIKSVDKTTIDERVIKTQDFSLDSYIHTEANYKGTTGKGIIIQNSYPRGGGFIFTPGDTQYGHAVFWTRILNKGDKPLELTLNFPSDSIVISQSPNAHFKLLVPPDTMTLDKVSAFNFGLERVKPFVKSNFYHPSQLQRTINPNEEGMFYTILLSHAPRDRGVRRTGLFLDEKDLFYKLSIDSLNYKSIPCGQIAFKK